MHGAQLSCRKSTYNTQKGNLSLPIHCSKTSLFEAWLLYHFYAYSIEELCLSLLWRILFCCPTRVTACSDPTARASRRARRCQPAQPQRNFIPVSVHWYREIYYSTPSDKGYHATRGKQQLTSPRRCWICCQITELTLMWMRRPKHP